MLYTIVCQDAENALEKRLEYREQHRARLKALNEAGKLHFAGPLYNDDDEKDICGSLLTIDFDSHAEAQAWAHADPYYQHGVYQEVMIKRVKQLLP